MRPFLIPNSTPDYCCEKGFKVNKTTFNIASECRPCNLQEPDQVLESKHITLNSVDADLIYQKINNILIEPETSHF